MDINGATDYVFDDNQLDSEFVLWSSLKTTRFNWKNKLTTGSTLATVTSHNTTTTFTFPFTGSAIIMSRGIFEPLKGMYYSLNDNLPTLVARQSNTKHQISSNFYLKVKIGDKLVFTLESPVTNIEIQIMQI